MLCTAKSIGDGCSTLIQLHRAKRKVECTAVTNNGKVFLGWVNAVVLSLNFASKRDDRSGTFC